MNSFGPERERVAELSGGSRRVHRGGEMSERAVALHEGGARQQRGRDRAEIDDAADRVDGVQLAFARSVHDVDRLEREQRDAVQRDFGRMAVDELLCPKAAERHRDVDPRRRNARREVDVGKILERVDGADRSLRQLIARDDGVLNHRRGLKRIIRPSRGVSDRFHAAARVLRTLQRQRNRRDEARDDGHVVGLLRLVAGRRRLERIHPRRKREDERTVCVGGRAILRPDGDDGGAGERKPARTIEHRSVHRDRARLHRRRRRSRRAPRRLREGWRRQGTRKRNAY